MTIAGCYARKSTDEGDKSEDAKSVTLQVTRAREFAKRHGWEFNDEHVYSDDGISGAEFKRRPGLIKLLAALTPRPAFNVLIVSEVSRLGRDTIRTLGLIQQLQDAGVQIYSYLDDREVAVDSDMGEIEQFMKSFAAADASRKGSQRTSNALRKRAEQGKPTGGTTYGYTNGVINHAQAAVIRRIFKLRAQGLGYYLIGQALQKDGIPSPHGSKHWHRSEISYLLRNETYIGIDVYGATRQQRKGGTSITIKTPEAASRTELPKLRIIDDKLWKKVQEVNAQASERSPEKSRATASKWLLPPVIACGLCGGHMSVNAGGGGKPYYTCTRSRQSRALCPNSRAVLVEKADKAIIQKFERALTAHLILTRLQEFLDGHEPIDPAPLHARKKTLEAERKRLVDSFARGDIPEIHEAIRSRNAELERVEAELQRASIVPQKLVIQKGRGRRMLVKPIPGSDFERRVIAAQEQSVAAIRAKPEEAQVVLRRLLPKRLTVTPTPTGFRFDGFVDYSAILKDAGYEQLAILVEGTLAKTSKTRASAG